MINNFYTVISRFGSLNGQMKIDEYNVHIYRSNNRSMEKAMEALENLENLVKNE